MIVVDSVNLILLSFNADNETTDTNSIREIVEFETDDDDDELVFNDASTLLGH